MIQRIFFLALKLKLIFLYLTHLCVRPYFRFWTGTRIRRGRWMSGTWCCWRCCVLWGRLCRFGCLSGNRSCWTCVLLLLCLLHYLLNQLDLLFGQTIVTCARWRYGLKVNRYRQLIKLLQYLLCIFLCITVGGGLKFKTTKCRMTDFSGRGSKFGATKCRMTDISKFQNCEY